MNTQFFINLFSQKGGIDCEYYSIFREKMIVILNKIVLTFSNLGLCSNLSMIITLLYTFKSIIFISSS